MTYLDDFRRMALGRKLPGLAEAAAAPPDEKALRAKAKAVSAMMVQALRAVANDPKNADVVRGPAGNVLATPKGFLGRNQLLQAPMYGSLRLSKSLSISLTFHQETGLITLTPYYLLKTRGIEGESVNLYHRTADSDAKALKGALIKNLQAVVDRGAQQLVPEAPKAPKGPALSPPASPVAASVAPPKAGAAKAPAEGWTAKAVADVVRGRTTQTGGRLTVKGVEDDLIDIEPLRRERLDHYGDDGDGWDDDGWMNDYIYPLRAEVEALLTKAGVTGWDVTYDDKGFILLQKSRGR